MLTITKRFRTIVILGAVAAALACTGVASAASVARAPGSRLAPVLTSAAPPMTIALDPSKVGGAGIPGYDDAACEGLANDYNTLVQGAEDSLAGGDEATAATDGELANRVKGQIDNNCLVID
jgi:hypothetical protein